MSDDNFGFALPPFNPDEAHQTLRRELRALALSEREGRFERNGQALARAEVTDSTLQVALFKRPSKTSPEWQTRTLTNSAGLRDFVSELKKRMALWSERDD